MKHGKKYKNALKKFDIKKIYSVEEAVTVVKDVASAKFSEAVDIAVRLGVDPKRCVYVGDDHRDIVAGLAAGMGTVAATYGYLGAAADTAQWGAHAAISAPNALLPLLLR